MRKTIVLLVILSFAFLFLTFTPARAAGTCSFTAGQRARSPLVE